MYRSKLFHFIKSTYRANKNAFTKIRNIPVALGVITTVKCDGKEEFDVSWDADNLGHEFLIRQATTVNVNAATQLLTVTLVAIQDTSERLRDAITKEICLVKQSLEWGQDGTPPHHWDQLVAIRGLLCDLRHNLHTLLSYMDYAEKLATVVAEISYLSGNIAASDAICERIDHACRTCKLQKQLTDELCIQNVASLFRWVSMSTRQMGQCLFVLSHWSTHSIWNRCMQGSLLQSACTSKSERQMVHFSSWWWGCGAYRWRSVVRSMVAREAPRGGARHAPRRASAASAAAPAAARTTAALRPAPPIIEG